MGGAGEGAELPQQKKLCRGIIIILFFDRSTAERSNVPNGAVSGSGRNPCFHVFGNAWVYFNAKKLWRRVHWTQEYYVGSVPQLEW